MSSWSRTALAPPHFVVLLTVVGVAIAFLLVVMLGVPVAGSSPDASGGQQATPTAEEFGAVTDSHGTDIRSRVAAPSLNASAIEESRTEFYVELAPDGAANWQVTTEVALTTDEEEAAFRRLGQSFENGDVPALGLPEFESAVREVNAGTDRNMRLSEVFRTWDIRGEDTDRTGELELAFTWESFGHVGDGRLVIDEDVLTLQSGELWFRGLTADQRLTIRPPEGYGVDDASIAPREGALVWTGPADFDESTLQATFLGNSAGNDDVDLGNGDEGLALLPWLFVGLIVVLALVLAFTVSRRDGPVVLDDLLGREDDTPDGETTEGKRVEVEDATETDVDEADDEIDVELLSDEERVERLLERNGGRMKQANIVKETDWSNAKVSQLLSAMEEEGRIDKLRIGRENLISFPDENVAQFDTDE